MNFIRPLYRLIPALFLLFLLFYNFSELTRLVYPNRPETPQPNIFNILNLSDEMLIFPDGPTKLDRKLVFSFDRSQKNISHFDFFLHNDWIVRNIYDVDGKKISFEVGANASKQEISVSSISLDSDNKIYLRMQVDIPLPFYRIPSNEGSVKFFFKPGAMGVGMARYEINVWTLNPVKKKSTASVRGRLSKEVKNNYLESNSVLEGNLNKNQIFHSEVSLPSVNQAQRKTFQKEIVKPNWIENQKLVVHDKLERDLLLFGVVSLFLTIVLFILLPGKIFFFEVFLSTKTQRHEKIQEKGRERRKGGNSFTQLSREESGWVWILFVMTVLLLILFQPILLQDNLHYLSYIRSMWMDGDLNLYNEWMILNDHDIYAPDPRKPIGPTGTIWFYLPFWLAGHFVTKLLYSFGFSPNGFSLPYLISVGLGGWLYCLMGVLLTYGLCRKFYETKASLFAVLSCVLGTNLLMMTAMWTGATFQPSFFLFSLFFSIWWITFGKRSVAQWALLGLVGGFMVQTRFQNVFFLILPFMEILESIWLSSATMKSKRGKLPQPDGATAPVSKKNFAEEMECSDLKVWRGGPTKLSKNLWTGISVFLVLALAGFSPQISTWFFRSGEAVHDIYGVSNGRFVWDPSVLSQLFWTREGGMFYSTGLLTATPVTFLAVVGFVTLYKHHRRIAIYSFTAVLLQIGVLLFYKEWYGKMILATPYLISCTPIAALAMASIFKEIFKKPEKVRFTVYLFLFVAFVWNLRCILLQQMFDEVVPRPDRINFWEGLHSLIYLPAQKVHPLFMSYSGEFSFWIGRICLALRSGMTGVSLLWISFALISACLLFMPGHYLILHRSKIRSFIFEPVLRYIVMILCLAVFFINGWVAFASKNTDKGWTYWRKDWYVQEKEIRYNSFSSNSIPFNIHLDSPAKWSHLDLLTFVHGMHNLSYGDEVVRVIVSDENKQKYQWTLIMGQDTDDYRRDIMEINSSSEMAPARSWTIRDESDFPYQGHEYLGRIYFDPPIRISKVRFEYLNEEGKISLTHLRAYSRGNQASRNDEAPVNLRNFASPL